MADVELNPADVEAIVDLREGGEAWHANVCGLTVATRLLMTLRHAGTKRVVLVGELAERIREDAEKHPYNNLEIVIADDVPAVDSSPRLVITEPIVLSSDAVKSVSPSATPEGVELPAQWKEEDKGFVVPVTTAAGRRLAGKRIRKSCRKPVEFSGIMSVLFKQSIVLQMTRLVSRTPLTPNTITVLSLFIGVIAIPLYLDASYTSVVIAGAILFTNNLFDILDGQIARMKFRFSPFGERLDNLIDGTLNVLILAPIGIGLHKSTGHVHWEIMGWVGSAGSLSYVLMVEYYSWRKGLSGYATNMQFFYRLNRDGEPKRPPVHTAPKKGIRRYLAPKYFMRKDFLFTMYLVFGFFGLHMVPFSLMVAGSLEYGLISWVQVLFFHDRIRFAGTHKGSV